MHTTVVNYARLRKLYMEISFKNFHWKNLMYGNTNAPRKSTCAKKTALLLTQGSRNAVFLSARRNYLSTCLSTHLRTQTLACQFGSSKAVRVYLFIGKRAVRCAEEHLKRQRLLGFAEFFVAENIEQLNALKQLSRAFLQSATNLLRWQLLIHDQCDILVQSWER